MKLLHECYDILLGALAKALKEADLEATQPQGLVTSKLLSSRPPNTQKPFPTILPCADQCMKLQVISRNPIPSSYKER